MINISTSHAVSWPTPGSPSVTPVSPVTAVQPAREAGRETGRDAQTGFGAGRDGQGASPRSPATRTRQTEAGTEAAPLLPRSQGLRGAEGVGAPAPTEQQKNAEKAEQAAAQAAKEQAEAAERKPPPLQAVLATVWEASAAVVERALGRLGGAEAEVPGMQSDTAPVLSAVAAAQMNRRPLPPAAAEPDATQPLPWPVMSPSDDAPLPVGSSDEGLAVEDLVAYDEHGNGSRAPIEAGILISERV